LPPTDTAADLPLRNFRIKAALIKAGWLKLFGFVGTIPLSTIFSAYVTRKFWQIKCVDRRVMA
jgi:hypothetical protein